MIAKNSSFYKLGKIHFILLVFALMFTFVFASADVDAKYRGGRLIDDSVFLKSNTMNKWGIQSFLKNKGSGLANKSYVLNCYESDSKERQWYTAAGAPCDKKIKAAHIIYYAAQVYGVNPQVILSTLQKEQSLITSPNPTSWQISQAMGYGCPTSGSCSSESNFFWQIDAGTWVLRYHFERARGNMTWWRTSTSWVCGTTKKYYKPNLYPKQNVRFYDQNNVHYRTHYLHNAATSSMYCYTPHAYNNPEGLYGLPKYGTKGKYYTGSYNFVYWFERWFGPTIETISVTTVGFENKPYTDNSSTATFKLTNNTKSKVSLGDLRVVARGPDDQNVDFATDTNVTINAGKTYTYKASRKLLAGEGEYTFHVGRYDDGKWKNPPFGDFDQPNNGSIAHFLTKQPTLTTSLSLSKSSVNFHRNQEVTASFSVKNNSAYTVNIGWLKTIVRDSKGKNYDFPSSYQLEIAPGATYNYSASRVMPVTGDFSIWIGSNRNYWGWSRTFPVSINSSIVRSHNIYVKPSVTLYNHLKISMPNPVAGQSATATFTINNYSDNTVEVGYVRPIVRDSRGNNYDFPNSPYLTLDPGESYSYNKSRTLPKSEVYTVWVGNYRNNIGWTNRWPADEVSSIIRQLQYNIHNYVRVMDGLEVNASGQTVTGKFLLKNHGSNTYGLGHFKVVARDEQGNNYDLDHLSPYVQIASGDEYEHTASRTLPVGKYTLWIGNYRDGIGWSQEFPYSQDSSEPRSQTITIN